VEEGDGKNGELGWLLADFAAGLLLAAAALFAAVFLAAGLVAADFLAVAIFKPPHYRIGKLRHVTHH